MSAHPLLGVDGSTSEVASRLSVIVLTLNEASNLDRCLLSVRGLASEIFVVDSGSTDATAAIAARHGAAVVPHAFEGHSRQWNWAFGGLPLSGDWVLGLDADQALTPELAREIREVLPRTPLDVGGFYVKRRQIFRGRWIRHGGYYPKYLLKLARRGRVRADESERLDSRFHVDGRAEKLREDIVEDNRNEMDISFWIQKHLRYAEAQAAEEEERRSARSGWAAAPSFFGSPDQRVLWLKSLWYRLPLYWRPVLYFTYRYFLRLGFLDGKEGFVFHFLQAFWFRLVVDIRLDERLKRSSHGDMAEAATHG